MDGGGKDPLQCYNEIKKPSAYRVKLKFYQKRTPQICLILHQFNLYVSLICRKQIRDD